MKLFLDCDGVLANFNKGFEDAIGMYPRTFEDKFGTPEFWRRVTAVDDFFTNLELMADAMELYEGVKHLDPTILTACPMGGWAEDQKVRWAAKRFPGVPIITCMAAVKSAHGKPGDILIDDYNKNRKAWEDMGGIFILHVTALQSLISLSLILKKENHRGIHII